MTDQNSTAPSIDVNKLGQAARIKRWLNAGETIELRDERERVAARIVPAREDEAPRKQLEVTTLQKRSARRKAKS